MADGGWTPDAIDAMPMTDVLALLRWWRDHPPVAAILAAVHKIKPSPLPSADDPSSIGDLLARYPNGQVTS